MTKNKVSFIRVDINGFEFDASMLKKNPNLSQDNLGELLQNYMGFVSSFLHSSFSGSICEVGLLPFKRNFDNIYIEGHDLTEEEQDTIEDYVFDHINHKFLTIEQLQ